nr:replication protein A 70 kDa DNA-binding subunit B-like [Ipomoea batatas]
MVCEDLIGRVVSITEEKVIQVHSKPQRLIDLVIEDTRLPRFLTPIRSISSRSRISGSGTIEALSSENITLTSLKDIYDNKKVGEFWVLGEILSVESEWYFNACMNKVCGKKLQDCTDQMYCKPCNTYSPDGIIKYKVVIDVLDDDQDGPLVLWDNVCSTLLGVTASELKEKYSKVRESIHLNNQLFGFECINIMQCIIFFICFACPRMVACPTKLRT